MMQNWMRAFDGKFPLIPACHVRGLDPRMAASGSASERVAAGSWRALHRGQMPRTESNRAICPSQLRSRRWVWAEVFTNA